MSRHLCGHCQAVTPTTGTPNDVEGYFISDLAVEGDLGHYQSLQEPVMDYLERRAVRAGRCPECGMVTLFPEDVDNA